MAKDFYGNEVSDADPSILSMIDHFTKELLQIGQQSGAVLTHASTHPHSLLLQTYAALILLYGQTRQNTLKAKKILEAAKPLLAKAHKREQSFYHAVCAWQKDHLSEALRRFENHHRTWPRDLAALKAAEYLFYCKGQKFESKRFLNTTLSSWEMNQQDPFFLSIHSFALELNEQYEKAKQTAEQSLSLEPKNPWAHHTLTHVYLNTGKIQEGIQALENFTPIWKESHHIIESHNLWHLALLYLEELDFKKVEEVYQRANWSSQASFIGEEIDAAALLWRLDMEGIDSSRHWQNLALFIQNHLYDDSIPFVSLHLFYALKKAGQEDLLKKALENLSHFISQQQEEDRKIWENVGLPSIYGSLALAEKNYSQALSFYDPIIDQIGCVGGSDAQIDLFRQSYFKALVGAGRKKEAQEFWKELIREKPPSPLERKWLTECSS